MYFIFNIYSLCYSRAEVLKFYGAEKRNIKLRVVKSSQTKFLIFITSRNCPNFPVVLNTKELHSSDTVKVDEDLGTRMNMKSNEMNINSD